MIFKKGVRSEKILCGELGGSKRKKGILYYFLDHKTRKIAIGENCHSQKVYDIFPIWQFVQEICHTYLLLPTHLPGNYEKVKVCHGKENNCDYCGPIVKFYSV